MVPTPGGTSSSKERYGPDDIDTLLPAIVTAVVLCSILTTGFTAARLLTKLLTKTFDIDDCEFPMIVRESTKPLT